jgi:hypothetical protein
VNEQIKKSSLCEEIRSQGVQKKTPLRKDRYKISIKFGSPFDLCVHPRTQCHVNLHFIILIYPMSAKRCHPGPCSEFHSDPFVPLSSCLLPT